MNKDTILGYSSIGKKLMSLAVYNKDNKKVENKKILRNRNKNSFVIFPFYLIMVLINNKSLGNYKYNTKMDLIKKY